MKKKKIVIHIDDHCDEDFNHVDIFHFKHQIEGMLADYDIEITSVTIEPEDDK